jgi:hypothetical protein
MVAMAIVCGLLVRNIDLGNLQPRVNTVIHYSVPLVLLTDRLPQPPKSPLRFGQMGF